MTVVIDESIVLDAEYSEDRWKLKNRVIYIGANGEVLADVSEGAGDLPVVVHDPYLTDPEEAERRAKIRLALNKEYGRSLRITMHQKDFKDLGIDLGDTCTINLPSVGLNNVDMVLLGIEYNPKSLHYRLEFGGRKELLEDWLDEKIGGDVARRFGKAMTLPEQTSTLAYSLDKIARIQADQKHVIYVNKPPLTLYNAQNVILNSDGEVELVSGATEGSFEAQVLPPSELFVNWIKSEWIAWRKRKYALSFEDPGDKIQRDGVIGEDQSFTAIVFAKIDEDGYFGLIDEDLASPYKREWTCMTASGQKLRIFMYDKDGNLYQKDFGGLPLGKVVMAGIMYDHENHKLYGILDGEILDTGLSPPSLREMGAPLSVGWVASDYYTLKGKIYAAYVWNRVLSSEEVSSLNGNPHDPPRSGLIVWWRLDEGSGSTVYDSSGNGNHGTIYGTSWIGLEYARVSAEFLNADGEMLGQVYDACDTQFYRFKKWPQGYGSLTYKNAKDWSVASGSLSDKKMGILNAYCLRIDPDYPNRCTITYPRFRPMEKHYDSSGWFEYGKDYLIVNSMQSGDFWFQYDSGSALFLMGDESDIIVKVLDPGVTQTGSGDRRMKLLMIRKSLHSFAPFLAISFDSDASHLTLCWRDHDWDDVEYMGDDTGSAWDGTTPFYLRFKLEGDVWKAYWSKDFSNWNYIGERDFGLIRYIGLCATEHQNGKVKYSRTVWINGEQCFIPEPLRLDLSWAKWIRLYLYADSEDDAEVEIRLCQDEDNYFKGTLLVKAKEWRKYEISMDSLSQVGSPSLSNINWIIIASWYPILIDSGHVFLPATRELMRARFTLKRNSVIDPSPKLKLVKIIWREGA